VFWSADGERITTLRLLVLIVCRSLRAIAIAASVAVLACSLVTPPTKEANMATSDTLQQTPYDITPRVWRDEQPGDEPRLVVSVTFVPRDSAERWQDVRLRTVEVRTNDQRWTPSESTVSPFGDTGDATLPAGAKATIVVTLQTSSGEKQLELPTEILRVS
jgi:hypothetical protein